MKCPYCGYKEQSYNGTTKLYTCLKCNALFHEDEEIDGRRIWFVFNIIICILLFIPILNILTLVVVNKFRVKKEYLETIISMFTVIFAVHMSIVLLFSYLIKERRFINKVQTVEDNTLQLVDSVIQNYDKYIIPDLYPKVDYKHGLQNTYDPQDLIAMYEGMIIDGNKVKDIIKFLYDYDYSFIIQTQKIRDQRIANRQNIILGKRLNGAIDDTGYSFIEDIGDGNYRTSYEVNDNGILINIPISQINDKKSYVFIDEEKDYLCRLIIDEHNNSIIGLIFIED